MDERVVGGVRHRIMDYFRDNLYSLGDGRVVKVAFEQIERSRRVSKGLDKCPERFREDHLRAALGGLVSDEFLYHFKGAYIYHPYGGNSL